LLNPEMDLLQSLDQITVTDPQTATGQRGTPCAVYLHHPETGEARTRIDAQYAYHMPIMLNSGQICQHLIAKVRIGIDILDIVEILEHIHQAHQLFRVLQRDLNLGFRLHGDLGRF